MAPASSADDAADDGPPVGQQLWRDLLFLHRPLPASTLRGLIPARLEVDTFEGQAWATLIPFAIYDSRPTRLPRALGLDFLEINLRTYVRGPGEEPGIWFFSVEASSWLAVAAARLAYALPYFPAAMERHREAGAQTIHLRSSRRAGGRGAGLEAVWQVGPQTGSAAPGSLDHFLIERYLLFSARGARLYRARVRHRPYPLSSVSGASLRESLFAQAGLPPLSGLPALAHHSPGVDVAIDWRHPVL
jgi:uncharacterized protein YqjF (DUF2071 family)